MPLLSTARTRHSTLRVLATVAALAGHPLTAVAGTTLTLEQAVATAQLNDPWLDGSEYRQQSLEAQGLVAGSLPDPLFSAGFANLPTDTFDFNQEAMTQFKLGVSQVFPRGDSRELKRRRLEILGSEHPYQRDDRRASVSVTVTALWLEAFRATETIRLIEKDRSLFEHLVDVAESSYASTRGRIRQQDIIRAQLELTRLEDRLTRLHEQLATSRSQLGEWLLPDMLPGSPAATAWLPTGQDWLILPRQLPPLTVARPDFQGESNPQRLASQLQGHPALLGLGARIDAGRTGIELAEQQYKPQWRINASYGYRDDAPTGNERADFFSVGVAVDMPLFTSSRQDQQVRTARANTEAARTDHALALRKMVAALASRLARLQQLDHRRELYQSRLLTEMHEQADAALSAYTNDDGDFAEVVRARIDELNASIDALDIEIERLKTISQLNYFFTRTAAVAPGDNS